MHRLDDEDLDRKARDVASETGNGGRRPIALKARMVAQPLRRGHAEVLPGCEAATSNGADQREPTENGRGRTNYSRLPIWPSQVAHGKIRQENFRSPVAGRQT
jgi:hypothetical protein